MTISADLLVVVVDSRQTTSDSDSIPPTCRFGVSFRVSFPIPNFLNNTRGLWIVSVCAVCCVELSPLLVRSISTPKSLQHRNSERNCPKDDLHNPTTKNVCIKRRAIANKNASSV